ncbi:MAG TPA: hypothetical protein VGT40_26110 [Methylomirabilota bacterium]|nr:hypothetical protein [Methylomirabilota bacterium]
MIVRIFLAMATAGFAIASALHLVTFTRDLWPAGDGPVLLLLAGAFVLLIAMVARLRRADAPTVSWRRFRFYDWRALVSLVPPPVRGIALATLLYVLLNSALSLVMGAGASLTASDGKFYLGEAGAERREISRDEYDARHRLSTRLYSGHLLLFYLVPLVYFRFVDHRLSER